MKTKRKIQLAQNALHFSLRFFRPVEQIKILVTELFHIKHLAVFLWALALLAILPAVFFIIAKPQPQNQINYGVNFSGKYAIELGLGWKDAYIKILDGLNVKNVRLVAYWDEIEKTPNVYDFSDILWQLDEAEKRNINVILALGRKVPRYPECFEPEWWKQLPSDQERNHALYAHVEKTVQTLKTYSSIKVWQVENEPFFPFGTCLPIKKDVVEHEVDIVRSLDNRPILIQDSGEGGFWRPSYKLGDNLGISMYRKIWYNFWGIFFGRFIYFQYPLAHWTYKIKADLVGVPYQKIIVTELQAEPWGPGSTANLSREEKDKTMSRADFLATISYAQKAGFKDLYFWGAEWWLFEKEKLNNNFYWDTAKALFN